MSANRQGWRDDGSSGRPFWPLLSANVTVRLLGSGDFSPGTKEQAATDLTAAAQAGALTIPVAPAHPLTDIAAAHDHVDNGPRNGRVLLAIPG